MSKNEKLSRDQEIDKQIILLSEKLKNQGLKDETLIVAVARIYSNSVIMAYIKEHGK